MTSVIGWRRQLMAGVVLSLLWKAGVAPKGEKTLTAVKLHNLENHLM